MNILLTTFGTFGDVNPIIGIAIELKNRGHKVSIITNPYFKKHVESFNLEFIGLGEIEHYLVGVENPDMWNPRKGFELVARNAILPLMRSLYEIITSYDPKKTIITGSFLCLGARVAQETHNFPLATIHLQPSIIRSTYDFPVLPGAKLPQNLPRFINSLLYKAVDFFFLDKILKTEVNNFRKGLGLSPVKSILGQWINSPKKIIGCFPEWFATPQPDWPKNTDLTGFIYFDGSKEKEKLSDEITDFMGEQTIVFTPGTAMKHAKDFFEVSIKASQKLGKRALLLTKFTSHLPNKLPPNVKYVEYLPFSLVLPKVAALVHHGGIGTSAQALLAGTPQLVMPLNHDQPDNANRLEKLGVAGVVYPEDYNVETVSKKLDYLSNSTKVLERCQVLKKKIDPSKALNNICNILEKFSDSKT